MTGELEITPGRVLGDTELVDNAKLNDLGRPVLRIKVGAISMRELADGQITADKLSADISAQLGVGDNSVTTAKIVDGAVTGAKVAPASLTADRMAGDVGANAWLSKTANYTAVPGDRIAADTSAGAFTVTLPAAPAAKTMVTLADAADSWGADNLTVDRNGSTIGGLAENLVCDEAGALFLLFFTGSTWRIYT